MMRRIQLSLLATGASFIVALAGCGGGGGSIGLVDPMPPIDEDTTMTVIGVPSNHGLGPMDAATIEPGASEERGNVELSCPGGGPACVVSVAEDGSVQYERTGGMPSVVPARTALAGLPSNHGLGPMDAATIEPGASEERGNVELSCPGGGPACVVSVAEDGSVQYERTGGMPSVVPARTALAGLPSNHGLGPMDAATIEPGASEERGNVELSCPGGGPACVVSVAEDGSVQYERTGGMPSVVPARTALVGLPSNHGLGPMDAATIEPGASEERGNVELSCPGGGPACVVSVAEDGSVQYERTGGMPSVVPARTALAGLPSNHGLGPMDAATIEPGASEERGNVELSCPGGGPACVVSVAEDGSVQYERTGGMPSVVPARTALAGLPSNHGLGPMDAATIEPGASEERGNVELSCPGGGPACVVSVAEDGSVQYERTGGMPSVVPARTALAGLPSNHGLGPMDAATIEPGASEERGNVELSCPGGGPACVVSVAEDGSVQYERTGGMPSVVPARTALAGLPSNHGLGPMDAATIEPGASEERGNVELSCPGGGPACVVSVAEDGSVQYERTGGMPSVVPARTALAGLPSNHGLGPMDAATIEPGASEERGNVELSCPGGGPACVVSVAEDGSVQYERTGGMPSVVPARTALAGLPSNHGLGPMDAATIEPGASEERGNVELSCPGGGPACVVSVAEDGSVQYERTGGMPSVHPFGLTRSVVAPLHASDSNSHTLAVLLPDTNSQFAPVTSATSVNHVMQTVNRTSDIHVKSISGDGDNGFSVTYVLYGEERTVHFGSNEYGTSDNPHGYYTTSGGARFWLSSETDSFSGTEKNRGSSEFGYFDANRLDLADDTLGHQQMYMTYGARTEESRLPAGKALYLGRMSGNVRDTNSVSDPASIIGDLRLTVDFAERQPLEGMVDGLKVWDASASAYAPLPDTTRFQIGDGDIAGGQFTAALKGIDDHSDAPLDQSVRGYEGGILGEFYGFAAQEVGGVLSAKRAADEKILFGWLGGKHMPREDPRFPFGDLSVLSWAAVERDFSAPSSAPADAAKVMAIETDGAAGVHLTYTIDGDEHQVHLAESDFESNRFAVGGYSKQIGARTLYLIPQGRNSFVEAFRFDYFNLDSFSVIDFADDGSFSRSWRGALVYGAPTETLPAAVTAEYVGIMRAEAFPVDSADFAARTRLRSNSLTLTANFETGKVNGLIDEILVRRPGERSYMDTDGQITIDVGNVADTGFTASLTGSRSQAGFTGEMTGQFYGPEAAEVAGVIKGTNTDESSVVQGLFGGKQQ